MDILIAFITGLTTGGLSCLAVQGGLLASSVAHEVELSIAPAQGRQTRPSRAYAARPIVLFLIAKLGAYTVLGFLLGWLGSLLQLSLTTRALFQFAIGLFMIGTALRMFNVHPIFRYFAFEPPSTVTRFIRRRSKLGASAVTPLFLGALTVLIPCGVTQAMMVVAMGTGNPFSGAAILSAFVLGTSPVFFIVAFLTTQLGARLESGFKQFVAVTVLILGLVSVDTGLNLLGSPYSFTSLAQAFEAAPSPDSTLVSAPLAGRGDSNTQVGRVPAAAAIPNPVAAQSTATNLAGGAARTPTTNFASAAAAIVTINVQDGGYAPAVQETAGGQPFQIKLITNNTRGCARAFVIPKLNIQKIMPATGAALIDIPPQPSGSELRYSCSMGMYNGKIVFK